MASISASITPPVRVTPAANLFAASDDDSDSDFDVLFSPQETATSLADSSPGDATNDIETVEEKQQTVVYQYYFLILIVGVLVFIALILCMRRRKRQRKTTATLSGRNALVRDLESWQPSDGQAPTVPVPTTARRWMQRYNRLGTRLGRTPEENENGLNELGEAPPPYKAREAALEASNDPLHSSDADTIAVPLRTLSRTAVGKPPGYDESVSRISIGTSSSSVSDSPYRPLGPLRATSSTTLLNQSQIPPPTPLALSTQTLPPVQPTTNTATGTG